MHPKDFYSTHVLSTYAAWSASRPDVSLFKSAAMNVSHMADHVFEHFKARGQLHVIGSPKNLYAYREMLRAECAGFGLIWDVADGHKHARITKRPAQVSSDHQTAVRRAGGAFGPGFGPGFDIAGEKVMIDKDDGTAIPGAPVLKRAQLMWKWKLESWGML